MKRAEAEKLLGGYATGTLTGTERRTLFEAALEHQDLFDALADEETLRELLADPAARAQVLATLAPAPSKIVPFWRRPGVIGAAAGIIMATTAGLVVLRSPEAQRLPAVKPETTPAPIPAPAASAPASPEAKAAPPPAPKAVIPPKEEAVSRRAVAASAAGNVSLAPADPAPSVPAQAPSAAGVVGATATPPPLGEEARARAQSERYQMEARDQLSKKADAAGINRAAAMMERVSPAPVSARRMAAKTAAPPAAVSYASQAATPKWILEALSDGSTRVTVGAPREAHVVLLRRGPSGVEVLKPATAAASEPWQFQLRLAPGDALDLYVMDSPVADPVRLPETGPVDGFRARIHPPAKK